MASQSRRSSKRQSQSSAIHPSVSNRQLEIDCKSDPDYEPSSPTHKRSRTSILSIYVSRLIMCY